MSDEPFSSTHSQLMMEWLKPIPGPLDHLIAWFTGEDFWFTYNRKWCWSARPKPHYRCECSPPESRP